MTIEQRSNDDSSRHTSGRTVLVSTLAWAGLLAGLIAAAGLHDSSALQARTPSQPVVTQADTPRPEPSADPDEMAALWAVLALQSLSS